MTPDVMSRPATDAVEPRTAEEAAEVIRDAAANGVTLRIVGRGMWLEGGRPVKAQRVLSTRAMTGIVEYEPGDLTLTARAGTSLAEIAATTIPERQWLTLDPPGTDDGTLGATAATASAGPLAHAFGLPRDAVLGIEIATGDGAVVRAGGRVVKNVAGFDLTRLFVGSWGTLGAITELTVRLRALPERDETVALPATTPTLARLRANDLTPLAVERLSPPLARHLGVDTTEPVVLVRLAGNAAAVASQRTILGPDATPVPHDVWRTLRAVAPANAAIWRCSTRPADLARLYAETDDLWSHATLSRGVVRCIATAEIDARLTHHRTIATVIGEQLPPAAWPLLAPGPTSDRLSIAVKQTFDPAGILNPGIFG